MRAGSSAGAEVVRFCVTNNCLQFTARLKIYSLETRCCKNFAREGDDNRKKEKLQMAGTTSHESPGIADKKLRFVPLGKLQSLLAILPDLKLTVETENNPEVMTDLVHKLGLSSDLSWHDVYSLDDPSLLAFVPRPVHALLLVFPVSKAYEKTRAEEDGPLPNYSGSGPNEEVLWFKQTIGNACGLMGLLHAVTNGMTREFIGSAFPDTNK